MACRVRFNSAAVLALACALGAQTAAPARAQHGELGLQRVRLYETGVGYFERRGKLGPNTRLRLPSSHLDDALKTLVVLDESGGLSSLR